MDIVIASNNAHKIFEIRQILKNAFQNIYSLQDVGIECDPCENGKTFLENAQIKAREIAKFTDLPVLADDTGLCVKTLNGEPGVYSARYAGNHDFAANRRKLLDKLKNIADRTAYFETAVVLRFNDGKEISAIGRVEGEILTKETGIAGFGYDSIFFCNDLKKSFGECTDEEKNKISHRGRALLSLLSKLAH
ncbi:MAG: RdgB/HAM1 family non-canonical purine NTP pyrophosphatase [Corallococcus sp.]|nr:RdgB/HAM1 family non-canonical purine NTP pyrophosphatase [Corallococcus sp.]